MRCEPTRALYSVLVLAHQSFVPSFYQLVRERVQMSEPVHLYGASPQGLCASVYGASPTGLCAVQAYKGFIQCAGARPPGLCTQCSCAHAGACADELGLLLLLLFLTFSALVANLKKILYTVANPAHGLLNREKKKKKCPFCDQIVTSPRHALWHRPKPPRLR